MNTETPGLILSSSPFSKRPVDTPLIMRHVIYSLLPVMLLAIYYFGISALLLLLVCIISCVLTEWLFEGRLPFRDSSIGDGSAVLTAILLALTLPPGLPLWMAVIGSAAAMIIGKILFGGLGQNIFNPSLTGRAFLQACFPVAMTTWAPISNLDGFFTLRGDIFALPFSNPQFDAISSATPLARMKFESQATQVTDLLLGSTPGSVGETSAVLILLGGAYLAYRKFLNWRIPLGIMLTVFVFATVLHAINADKYPDGLFHLLSGGLMLGAVFMATDPVTSPVTPVGCWIFAMGIGILVVVIRQFGGITEGVMYAILFMNAFTPLIDRFTQPPTYGTQQPDEEKGAG
jgi:H+/Na+-translocating ferredoxin:NAD+ oxidoreductase subunit D